MQPVWPVSVATNTEGKRSVKEERETEKETQREREREMVSRVQNNLLRTHDYERVHFVRNHASCMRFRTDAVTCRHPHEKSDLWDAAVLLAHHIDPILECLGPQHAVSCVCVCVCVYCVCTMLERPELYAACSCVSVLNVCVSRYWDKMLERLLLSGSECAVCVCVCVVCILRALSSPG